MNVTITQSVEVCSRPGRGWLCSGSGSAAGLSSVLMGCELASPKEEMMSCNSGSVRMSGSLGSFEWYEATVMLQWLKYRRVVGLSLGPRVTCNIENKR